MEEIAEVIETLDNLIAAMGMNLPAELHLKALRESLPAVKDRLKTAYLDIGGEDHWAQ